MLKKIGIVSLLLISLSLSAHNDHNDIRANLDGFTAAWNAHDTAKMASFWASNGDLINPVGKWGTGTAGVEQIFKMEHNAKNGAMRKSTIKFDVDNVNWVTSDIAFVDTTCTITGMTPPKGKATTAVYHVVMLMSKKDGKLAITSARPYALNGKLERLKPM